MKTEKPKPEYSAEQIADIKEQILADREREHRAIAGDMAYRVAYLAVAQEVRRGLYDDELLKVLSEEWEKFKLQNPILGKKPDTAAPEKKE